MSFKKPFRAVPIRQGKRYRKQRQRKGNKHFGLLLAGAGLVGAVVGVGSVAIQRGKLPGVVAAYSKATTASKELAVSAGFMRARAPQEGDNWTSCAAARAAGTAPIYSGEPGYRQEMDADFDGVACERYRGS